MPTTLLTATKRKVRKRQISRLLPSELDLLKWFDEAFLEYGSREKLKYRAHNTYRNYAADCSLGL